MESRDCVEALERFVRQMDRLASAVDATQERSSDPAGKAVDDDRQ